MGYSIADSLINAFETGVHQTYYDLDNNHLTTGLTIRSCESRFYRVSQDLTFTAENQPGMERFMVCISAINK